MQSDPIAKINKKNFTTSVFQGEEFTDLYFNQTKGNFINLEVNFKKFEVGVSNYQVNDDLNTIKHILNKSGVHYCDFNYEGEIKTKGKITFKVRENTTNRGGLHDKLTTIRDKIKTLGMEINQVNKLKDNFHRTTDVVPVSVKWDTKPLNYNKKTLISKFNEINKTNLNKESENNTLGKKFNKYSTITSGQSTTISSVKG